MANYFYKVDSNFLHANSTYKYMDSKYIHWNSAAIFENHFPYTTHIILKLEPSSQMGMMPLEIIQIQVTTNLYDNYRSGIPVPISQGLVLIWVEGGGGGYKGKRFPQKCTIRMQMQRF